MRWRDIDWTGERIHVRHSYSKLGGERPPKSGRVRSVPVIAELVGPLDGLSKREHFTTTTSCSAVTTGVIYAKAGCVVTTTRR